MDSGYVSTIFSGLHRESSLGFIARRLVLCVKSRPFSAFPCLMPSFLAGGRLPWWQNIDAVLWMVGLILCYLLREFKTLEGLMG